MPQNQPTVKDALSAKLEEALQPLTLEVIDESHQHAGHMMHPGGVEPRGETHFRIKIVSGAFSGKSRLERHRMINALADAELKAGVHALAIEAKATGEA
jgi:BolA protein